jgi:spore germination protein GerM
LKNGKIIVIFLIIALIICVFGYLGINYLKDRQVSSNIEISEYTPQEEISEDQMRETLVTLYFYNNELGKLVTETRLIDAVNLIENPYSALIQMLIDGPKNDKLSSLMPDNLKVNSTKIEDNCVTIDMSIEFLNNTEDTDLKNKMIYSIVNTLTELTEVDSVQFLIDGKVNDEFPEIYVRID